MILLTCGIDKKTNKNKKPNFQKKRSGLCLPEELGERELEDDGQNSNYKEVSARVGRQKSMIPSYMTYVCESYKESQF